MSQPEGSNSKHGQRRCSTSPILAPGSTICGCGEPTTHSRIGGRTGQGMPRSNRPPLPHRVRHLRALLRPRHRLDAHFKDNLPPLRHPSTLLISPGSVNTWLVDNQPTSLSDTQYTKWVKALKLPQPKQDILEKNLEKVNEWWQNQPDDASKTIQRASVAMGIDPCKHKGASTDEVVLKVMTVTLLMHS